MNRFLVSALVCAVLLSNVTAVQDKPGNPLNEPLGDPGVVPVGADGKPLNLNFESGTLAGWKAEGQAFDGQPLKGDISELRPRDNKKSEHTGQYWIGTYEKLRDLPQGTLTSEPFEVTHPYASFLVGGGSSRQTRVDIVTADDGRAFYGASGHNVENLQPVIVDMQPIKGRKVFIRIIDQASGGWGHINFDDFRFHSTRPRFKSLANELPTPEATALYPHAGLSAEEAAKNMVVPPGFSVQVAAAEPDVQQPVAMAIDDRGRIWIAEALQYPRRAAGDKGADRILVFEDTDLNGTLDKRTVFYEGLNLVSGLEVGFGGVWVGAAPYLYFIPDKDGDDKPDSEPVKLLDGWGFEDTHETLNSFIWGPDGWLYGCHGVFTHSKVGKPGTPDDMRVRLNAGVWRYHPVRYEFEVFAHGTSNPWGLDYDQYGNFFATACVIPHIFHIIPGARYERQAGQHFNPYTYDDIKTIADHRHYTGNQWNDGNRLQSDTLGGGHAHAGCMIYQGGAWPEKYRGAVFMNNIHGNRMNVDLLEPKGSGFVAHHGQDFLLTRDQWSQMLYMTYGPDGQVWVIDWYDRQQCHLREPDRHDRSNGRIYRIVYDNAKPVKVDLQKLSDEELVKLLTHENEWYVRHAQRVLQERTADKRLTRLRLRDETERLFSDEKPSTVDEKLLRLSLRVQRAIHASFGIRQYLVDEFSIPRIASNERAFIRVISGSFSEVNMASQRFGAWMAQVVISDGKLPYARFADDLAKLGKADRDPLVRLGIATGLQRLPLELRWSILDALTAHPEDAADHNLPLMYWYAMEPLADVDPPRALALAIKAGENIPILKEFMIRRIGAGDPEKSLALLVEGLKEAKDDATRLTFLRGMNESLKGRREVKTPAGWQEAFVSLNKSATGDLKSQLSALAVTFGDEQVIDSLRLLARDPKHSIEERRAAIRTLVSAKAPNTSHMLRHVVNDEPALRTDAIRGLAVFDDDDTPSVLLKLYEQFTASERRDALATLCGRPAYAIALLDAIAGGKVPTNHLTADLVTNLRNLNDASLTKRIEQVWGIVRSSPADKAKLIEDYKRLLADSRSPTPDSLASGRAVFAKTCQQCHMLFGAGSKVGPDITGSQRANLDYLLSNVLDPSAVMAKEYQPTVLRTGDGRTITGILKEETSAAISLQTQNELIVVPKSDIDESKLSDKSMMPDDLLKPLSELEVRSLVAYVSAGGQSPMLATQDNVGSFYNGKDLAGWVGDDHLWSVENGEIVGKTTTGIKKNEFLMSELSIGDFRLELEVKLLPNTANSGIQIRSVPIENGLMRGYQCDMGQGWWGKLYEEHGRALLEPKGGEQFVKKEDWNKYEIVAVGSRVRAWLNGQLTFDRDDPQGARSGLIALQVHSGGPTEVRFRNLKLTLIDPPVPARPYPSSKAAADGEPVKVSFKKTTLDRAFRSEGVGMGDFNNDGLLDISAGSVWYENPGHQVPSTQYSVPGASRNPETSSPNPKSLATSTSTSPSLWRMHVLGQKANSFDIKTYGDTFMNWAEDVNNDGRQDLIVIDFPGKQTWWFENPGLPTLARSASEGMTPEPWKKHVIVPVTNNESPQYADVDGDGRQELIYGDASKRLALARPQSNPLVEWKATYVAAPGDVNMVNFYHGLGIGDINKDGKNDILVPNGWWEAPTTSTTDPWTFHPAPFGQPQAQMYVYDFDADGDNDVVGSSAHRRGIWWYEQNGKDWNTHPIDESIAQTHALILADINGDGLPDLVTGKRFYAHNGRDPGEDEPPEIAWYELTREGNTPKWTKHVFDNDSGVGTQFEVHDMNADGLLDVIVANKRGMFYFEQQRGAQ